MDTSSFINSITVQVNGDQHICMAMQPLNDLLSQLNLHPKLIAIEYNGEILHRQYWSDTRLVNGDRLEIVTIVGGG
jgi:sulfur carrier protein